MNDLDKIQSLFWSAIADIHPIANQENSALDNLVDLQRLEIYKDTVLTAHVNALRISYPITAKLLGDSIFTGLAKGYVYHFTPTDPNLNHYGESFPNWLEMAIKDLPPLTELNKHLELVEFAKLEWALEQGYYAGDDVFSEPDLNRLHTEPSSTIGFKLHPSVDLFQFTTKVSGLLEMDSTQISPQTATALKAQPEAILVYRDHWKMQYQILTTIEAKHYQWITEQQDFEKIQHWHEYQEKIIVDWIRAGIVSGTHLIGSAT